MNTDRPAKGLSWRQVLPLLESLVLSDNVCVVRDPEIWYCYYQAAARDRRAKIVLAPDVLENDEELAVLAHEFGHHLQPSRRGRKEAIREQEAWDRGGEVLALLGASQHLLRSYRRWADAPR